MTYEPMKDLKPGDCKRACGVQPQTFATMLHVLRAHEPQQVKPGRPPKLSLEDRLFMPLQYGREYRPSFHIGLSWGVDASVVCRTVHKIANLLLKSTTFHVPGQRQWRPGGPPWDVLVIDGAASPVQRPQKNSGNTIVGRKNALPRKHRSSQRTRRARASGSQEAGDASTVAHCANGASAPYRKRASVEPTEAIKGYRDCTARARPPRRNQAKER
jgi:hypothetical protein